jgi:hypothetical protein
MLSSYRFVAPNRTGKFLRGISQLQDHDRGLEAIRLVDGRSYERTTEKVAVIWMSRVIATGVGRSDDRCWLGFHKRAQTMARI